MAGNSIAEFLKTQVVDWEDDIVTAARYKAFTGQRQDWESRYQFWKHLIVSVARQSDIIIIEPDEVQQKWFSRNGLLPLGMNTVLIEMFKSGELQMTEEFMKQHPSSVRWAFMQLTRAAMWAARTTIGMAETVDTNLKNQKLIVTELLKERTEHVVKVLNNSQWSTASVVTRVRFVELCGGLESANVVQQNLLIHKRAQRLEIEGDYKIEGLKISLNPKPVAHSTQHDLHLLQLNWTKEKVQQQISHLDIQVSSLKSSAAAAAKNGDRQRALRHLRSMKVAEASRETCAGFAERIDEVLAVISDAETTKKVTEAMQVGAIAIKEHHVTLEELHECLDDIAESVSQQKQLEEALEGSSSLTAIDTADAAFEHELAALEAELDHGLNMETSERISPGNNAEGLSSTDASTASGQTKRVTSNADGMDFERELAELEAELDSTSGAGPGDQRISEPPSRTPDDILKNPGVTLRRGSLGAADAGDLRQKESEKFEQEFSRLRIQLEPA